MSVHDDAWVMHAMIRVARILQPLVLAQLMRQVVRGLSCRVASMRTSALSEIDLSTAEDARRSCSFACAG